eukprot:CAMPEP_0180404406 /NCGR_PEP_ID=MMETSP0989-20121125/39989_1 /TAXON_ID=697907 /ORGANISM="non described non described, Strain CCMP2293" /LENGTH=104 /DNA_ID=CAMNT_0022407801 /DNA_START=88 /DNA_END=398 /DNA_ORIENTATION=+
MHWFRRTRGSGGRVSGSDALGAPRHRAGAEVAVIVVTDAVISVVVGVDAEEARVIVAAKGTLEGVAGGGPVGVEHLPVGHNLEEHRSLLLSALVVSRSEHRASG